MRTSSNYSRPHLNFNLKEKKEKSLLREKHIQEEVSADQEDKRPRTPSGQIISKSVEFLKSAIEERITIENQSSVNTPRHVDSVNNRNFNHDDEEGSCEGDKWCVNTWRSQDSESDYQVLQRKFTQMQQLSQSLIGSDRCSIEKVTSKAVQMLKNQTQDQAEGSEYGNPAVMDVRAVIDLIENMKIDLKSGVKEEIAKDDIILEMQKKIHVCEFKERTMLETMSRMNSTIQELKDKNEILEINNAKRMLILTSLDVHEKRKIARQQINAFIQEEVQADVSIEDFYTIGSKHPKDLVLIFQNASDKHKVLQNKQNIKDLVNQDGNKYYFKDFKTGKQNEINRRKNIIEGDMQYEDPVDRKEVKIQKGEIYIGTQKI